MKQIQLTRGLVTLVDDEDFERISRFKWHASDMRAGRDRQYHYAQRTMGTRPHRQNVLLHRFILGVGPEMIVDHRDGDGLNNQRMNLRACSVSENAANSFGMGRPNQYTRYKGVSFLRNENRWMARIGNASCHATAYLGCFRTAEEAARAYDVAARNLYGTFARLNFP